MSPRFTIAWSPEQQERLEALVADGRDLDEICRRMPGHSRGS